MQSRIGRIHAAQGGTLFLDEIGDLPLGLQSKLLRFLEQGEVQRLGSTDSFKVDVRVVAATNGHLRKLVQEKQFREDLYYRLAIFPIELPLLKDRMEDLPTLAISFLDRFSSRRLSLSSEATFQLLQHIGRAMCANCVTLSNGRLSSPRMSDRSWRSTSWSRHRPVLDGAAGRPALVCD